MSIDDDLNRIADRERLCTLIRDLPPTAEIVVMAMYLHEDIEVMELQIPPGTSPQTAYWMAGHLQAEIMSGGVYGEEEECDHE